MNCIRKHFNAKSENRNSKIENRDSAENGAAYSEIAMVRGCDGCGR